MAVSVEYKVNFFDTDAMAVVHHANYIRWFEIGRVAYLRHYDLTLDDMMDDGYVFPITKIDAKYLSPGRFDDVLIIETKATALTKAKMALQARCWLPGIHRMSSPTGIREKSPACPTSILKSFSGRWKMRKLGRNKF